MLLLKRCFWCHNPLDSYLVNIADVEVSAITSDSGDPLALAVLLLVLIWRMMGFVTSKCQHFLLNVEWRWCSKYQQSEAAFTIWPWGTAWCSIILRISYSTMIIIFIPCSLNEKSWHASIHLIAVPNMVHMSEPRFHLWLESVQESHHLRSGSSSAIHVQVHSSICRPHRMQGVFRSMGLVKTTLITTEHLIWMKFM